MEETIDNTPVQADNVPVQTTQTQEPKSVQSVHPETFKEKEWTKKFKTQEDVYKSYEELEKQRGKMITKPDFENEESRSKYYQSIRPEKPDDYAIPDVFEPAEKQFYQKLLHEEGISKYQAEKIFSKISGLREKAYDADGMVEELKKSWGSEVSAKTESAMKGLKQYAKQEDLAVFDKMPNALLAPVYRTVQAILEKHGAVETGNAGNNKADAHTPVDKTAEREAARKAMLDLAKRPHTIEEKNAAQQRYNNTYK